MNCLKIFYARVMFPGSFGENLKDPNNAEIP